MKKIILHNLAIAIMFFSFSVFLIPTVSFAQNEQPGSEGYSFLPKGENCTGKPLISGGGSRGPSTTGEPMGGMEKECTFGDLIRLINRGINLLFYLAVIFATFALIYAGFLLLTSGGNASKAEEAKKIFFKVVVGFLWIFTAWLIVHFITASFELKPDYSILQQQ